MKNEKLYKECDEILFGEGFKRKDYYYYRNNGNNFQCFSIGSGFEGDLGREYFVFSFPFWTVDIERIKYWPSFKKAFTSTSLFSPRLRWPRFGINISESIYFYASNPEYLHGVFPLDAKSVSRLSYIENELLPFFNKISDEISFKNTMVNINRHCRVFEEVILLECLTNDSLTPAVEWLNLMRECDKQSIKTISDILLEPDNMFHKREPLTDEEIYQSVEQVTGFTFDLFYGKIESAIKDFNKKDFYNYYINQQTNAKGFFEKYFELSFDIKTIN